MFFIASKLLLFFISPIGVLTIALIWAYFTKNYRLSKKILKNTLIGFYIFSTPLLVNEMLLLWEIPPTKIEDVVPHEWGVVLTGGITEERKLPAENIFLSTSADRVGQAIQLHRAGKIKKILISGGFANVFANKMKSESNDVFRYLVVSGIPKNVIYLENKSRNTRENAVQSALFFKSHPPQSILLITSGFHLRRADACFTKVGLKVQLYGCSYLSHEREFLFNYLFPGENTFHYSALLWKEIIGYLTYWVMGWV